MFIIVKERADIYLKSTFKMLTMYHITYKKTFYLDNYVNCFVYLGYFGVYVRCVISHASTRKLALSSHVVNGIESRDIERFQCLCNHEITKIQRSNA